MEETKLVKETVNTDQKIFQLKKETCPLKFWKQKFYLGKALYNTAWVLLRKCTRLPYPTARASLFKHREIKIERGIMGFQMVHAPKQTSAHKCPSAGAFRVGMRGTALKSLDCRVAFTVSHHPWDQDGQYVKKGDTPL
jgi:hypothetical protein